MLGTTTTLTMETNLLKTLLTTYSTQELKNFQVFVFMISKKSTLTFPFGDRRALVSIDSNCSRHMTGFYTLHNPADCNIIVDGAFAQGKSGRATYSGTMQLGNIFFDDTLFVDGICETIISLGQLDQQGCRIESSRGVMKVFGPDGTFMFSAFLHNGRYFLDTQFYYGPNILKQVSNGGSVSAFAVSDARHDNSAELWHCRMGHVNYPDMKRLQRLATGVQIAVKHKLSFCEPCIMAKLKNHPLQNQGEKPSRPKQVNRCHWPMANISRWLQIPTGNYLFLFGVRVLFPVKEKE